MLLVQRVHLRVHRAAPLQRRNDAEALSDRPLSVAFQAHGVKASAVSPTTVGDMVEAKLTAAQASVLFQARLSRFSKGKVGVIRALEYTVPEEIAAAVTVSRQIPRSSHRRRRAPRCGHDRHCAAAPPAA